MNDKIYPTAKESSAEDSIDPGATAAEIIQLRESGAPAGYKGFKEGDPLGKKQICGIVQHGKNAPVTVSALYGEIEDERRAFRSVSPGDFTTETAYKTELGKKQKYLDINAWVSGMKAEAGVSTWADLKAAHTSTEK